MRGSCAAVLFVQLFGSASAFSGLCRPRISLVQGRIRVVECGSLRRSQALGAKVSTCNQFLVLPDATKRLKAQSLDTMWAEYDGDDFEDGPPRSITPNPLIPAERYTSADWLKCLLSLPFSFALRRVSSHILANTIFSIAIWILYGVYPKTVQYLIAGLSTTPHMLLGSALGLLLVFRTNTAYDRFWEARKLWGSLISRTREVILLSAADLTTGLTTL